MPVHDPHVWHSGDTGSVSSEMNSVGASRRGQRLPGDDAGSGSVGRSAGLVALVGAGAHHDRFVKDFHAVEVPKPPGAIRTP